MTEPDLTPEQLQELRSISQRVLAQFNVYDQMMKDVDLSGFLPRIEATGVLNAVDLTSSYRRLVDDVLKAFVYTPPKFDFPVIDLPVITFPVIDMGRLVDQWRPSLAILAGQVDLPSLDSIFADILRRLPANWPSDEELTLDLAKQIVQDEGIPIVYIPRADIVSELVLAADRAQRCAILVARSAEILEDCNGALDAQLDSSLDGLKLLLLDAFRAFELGVQASAQSMAVSVCTTLIDAHLAGKYPTAKKMCRVTDLGTAMRDDRLRYELGIAPVVNLLTEWNPRSGQPRPAALSRHVSTHQAHPDHFTPENAILAVMVATSLILALNERLSWT
ncbi:hypothetical protein ACIGO9_28655 [Nocardia asteroides]|uniref:hypothetical protein n=1 Tax=Nocardia asteroides TaxID=1824 RepID=UPI0037C93DFD